MGQTVGTQSPETIVENTFDTIQYEFGKHAQTFKEIGPLTYEEFNNSLTRLNDLSRKCLDSNGQMTIFAVKKGSDQSFLWKVTVRIACVKLDPESNRILNHKLINLRQFLKVFNNFEKHLEAMSTCEEQHDQARRIPNLLTNVTDISPSDADEPSSIECCICLDRKADLILPCEHVFCSTCIEKWNDTHKKCPICQSNLDTVNDSWVLSELPLTNEVCEKIITELNALTTGSGSQGQISETRGNQNGARDDGEDDDYDSDD